VAEDERTLTEANALLQAANRITIVLGPALAGGLIAVVGAANVLLIDAVTFALGFVLVTLFVRGGDRVEHDEETKGLTAGARFLARDSLLRPWSIAIIVGDAGWLVLFATMPVLVLESYGEQPALLGWIWGGWGLGAVIGSLVTFRIGSKVDRMLVASVGELAMVLPLWLLLADLPSAAVVALMWVSGFTNGIINAPIWTIFTLRTPAALRAKAVSVILVATAVIGPVALLAAGRTLDDSGFVPVVAALVAVQTLAAVAFTAAGLRHRAVARAEPVAGT
jgi:predicted MFS family arabinose efflux permease